MDDFRYLSNVTTLLVDVEKCTGCGRCLEVCPHRVLMLKVDTVSFRDKNACSECGACAVNCPYGAITVKSGTSCAPSVLRRWLKRKGFPLSDRS